MKTKNIWIGVSIFIVSMILLTIFLIDMRNDLMEEIELEKSECYELEECEIYSCLAEKSLRYKEERNLLLKEQNCLLRKGLLPSVSRTGDEK